jgi:hypothetical protein
MTKTQSSVQISSVTDFKSAFKKIPLYLSIFVFVLLVSTALFLPSRLGPTPHNWFSDYAQALLEGKLYVGEASQWRGCKWDQSFFEGKCYLYFGIVPAFFHLILPFFTNRFFSILMTSIFVFFFSKIILKLSRLKPDDSIDWFVSSLLILTAVFAGSFFSLALGSRVYDETICFAHAFGIAGVYYALPFLGVDEENGGSKNLVLASLMFTLASLTRFTWFGPFGLFCLFVLISKRKIYRALPFGTLALAAGFQGWLNWARFHDPFELGMTFQSFVLSSKEKGRDLGLNTFPEALKVAVSYYFIRFFPEGNVLVTKTTGFLQNFFLKDTAILFESPHTLAFSAAPVFFPVLEFRTWWAFVKQSWRPLILLTPLIAAVISIQGVVHRYQFEVSAPLILASLPFLVSKSEQMNLKMFKGIILACLVGIGFSIYCSYEVLARFWSVM